MNKKLLTLAVTATLFTSSLTKAQIAANYEVATWHQFKTAALSYTFDDNCSNQLPVALPLFDKYGFKVTFFAVTSWGPNWTGLKNASANGHEVASHTVSHPSSLAQQSVSTQDSELKNSQSTIISNVPTSKCETVAYPNCNIGDLNTIKKYYIAGRICSNAIIGSSPSDFYNLSSIITGSTGSVQTAQNFNDKANSAKNSKGWCVFLTHGIDSDGGYSPTQSSALNTHLGYVNTNSADFWVGTFAHVAKYIKERNALNLAEQAINTDSLQLTPTDNLDNAVYNVPVTVRRLLPNTWQNAKVYAGSKLIESTISTISGKKYVTFDVVPDQGKIYLANPNKVITDLEIVQENNNILIDPNPFADKISLKVKGDFTYHVLSLDGSMLENGTGSNELNIGAQLAPGMYLLKISRGKETTSTKIMKK